ncbi:MAG: hypothetical protein LBB88_03545 [Planctomycetaceae bacterium]|jgi:hypothetical protein|nr:hypothetical protein [Planctomycetaceae bacterium]
MPCVSLFDQKITDRDAKHCVSTFGLAIQIRIKKSVNGYKKGVFTQGQKLSSFATSSSRNSNEYSTRYVYSSGCVLESLHRRDVLGQTRNQATFESLCWSDR